MTEKWKEGENYKTQFHTNNVAINILELFSSSLCLLCVKFFSCIVEKIYMYYMYIYI